MSKEATDEYIRTVIQPGDEGSEYLNKRCAPTLKNSKFVDVLDPEMGGQRVLRIPDEYRVVVHSAGGDPDKDDLKEHAGSLVDRLVEQAKAIGATPIAFANVVDASTGERSDLELIADGLTARADHHKVAIMTGELAILGKEIVTTSANVSGTMISIIRKDAKLPKDTKSKIGTKIPGAYYKADVAYAIFDHQGKAVTINSDGIGTKVKWYEMTGKYYRGLGDSAAMKVDDTAKSGATVVVISDVIEHNGKFDLLKLNEIDREADVIGNNLGAVYILQKENVGDRLRSYNGKAAAFNVSGSAVCLIDEERLKNPLKPSAGEYLIAIRGKPNPRSNGISAKRKIINSLGEEWCRTSGKKEWHETEEGKMFMEYLAEPSTILYSVFKDLIDKDVATSVYHLSGGAWDGKLARPLAKHGLFAKLKNIFPPDWRESALVGHSFTPAEAAYAKWPMGTDGFITTTNRDEAIKLIEGHGLEAKLVSQLELAKDGRTGVEFAGIKALDGKKDLYFSGKD